MFFGGHSSNPGASGEVRGPVPHSAGGAKPLQWTNGVGLDEEVSICRTLQLSVNPYLLLLMIKSVRSFSA